MSLLLVVPGVRARAYLQTLLTAGLGPSDVLILGGPGDDPTACPGSDDRTPDESLRLDEPVRETLDRAGLGYRELPTLDIHDASVAEAVAASGAALAIFTGGGILQPTLLQAGPRWIHVHPGRLPDHRGSTCIFYSMLLDGKLSASAFFMEPGLDVGTIIVQRTVDVPPGPPTAFDHGLDVWLRAQILREAMQRLTRDPHQTGVPQSPDQGQLFYVVHPVLKHLALRHSYTLEEAPLVHPA